MQYDAFCATGDDNSGDDTNTVEQLAPTMCLGIWLI